MGEIPYYFKNQETAYITEYSADGFNKAMNDMMEDRETANKVGHAGFMLGREHFDSKANAIKMLEFISKF